MKTTSKILSVLLILAMVLSIVPATVRAAATPDVTISFKTADQRVSTDDDSQVWKNGLLTVTNNKAGSTTKCSDKVNPVRFYKSSSLTIEYVGMKAIVVHCSDVKYATALEESVEGATVTKSSKDIYISLSEAQNSFKIDSLSAAVWIISIDVYKTEVSAPEPFVSKLNMTESAEIYNSYKLGVCQMNLEKDLYFKGTFQSDKYMETTEKVDEAVNIYLENAESGGFYIYFMTESTKTYLCVYGYQNGEKTSYGVKGVTDAASASVFSWNETHKVLTTKVGNVEYYLGCYNTFATFSPSNIDRISTSYPAYLCKAEHTHSFPGDWTYDASEHWKECVCGLRSVDEHHCVKKATEDGKGCYDECTVCGYRTSGGPHGVVDWTIIKEATTDETGLKTGTCRICNTVVEEVISKLHKCTAAEGWEYNDDRHWHVCTGEGCTEQLNKAEHNWVEDTTKEVKPTCTEKGKMVYNCECGATKTEEIAAIGHKLTKVEKVDATTEKEGCKEHYKCECGKLFTDAEGKNETTADKLAIAKLTNTETDKKDDTSDKKDETTGSGYTKVTDGKLVSGTYVLVTSNGYAPTVLEKNWLLSAQPTVSGNKVTDAKNAVLVLTVDGNKVKITDANGNTVINQAKNNKLDNLDGMWNWKYDSATGTFTFDDGVTEEGQTRYLAAAGKNDNKFRAYRNPSSEPDSYGNTYYHQFTLYKLSGAASSDKKDDVKPSKTELKPISKAPVAETGYKFGMYNKFLNKKLYFSGEMNGYYLGTTTDASKAAEVFLETVEGGYKLYFKNAEGKKQYIEIYDRGEGKVGVQIVDSAETFYTWNADLKLLVTKIGSDEYYLGTYVTTDKDTGEKKTYETMGASKTSYITGDNASKVGETQFPTYLYEEVNVATGDNTNVVAIVAIMIVAMAGMAVIVTNRKNWNV